MVPHPARRWSSETFEQLTDFVAVVDFAGTLLYANPFAERLLGLSADDVLGRNVAEFIHPDDLNRAYRVIEMLSSGDGLRAPVTPALYRLLRGDGSWCRVEVNGSPLLPSDSDGVLVIVGRYSGDRDLLDRILQDLTSGTPAGEVVALVPDFGTWRHPDDHYAVLYTGDDGVPLGVGSRAVVELALADPGAGAWGQARATGVEAVVGADDLPDELRQAARARGLDDCWAIPVADPSFGEPAVILVWTRSDGPVLEVHRNALENMERVLALILQWRAQVATMRRAARHDPLTGLANRTGFWEVLEGLGEDHDVPRVGILYIDLDGFKAVNDDHGHRIGDLVLAEAARRLAAVLRPGDAVARLGGDEFAVVCRDLGDDQDAVAIAERVIAELDRPFEVDGRSIGIGASVGIATVSVDQLDPDLLLETADRGLYEAKRQGRSRWHLASA